MSYQTFPTTRFLLPVVVTGVLALVAPAFGQVINEDIKLFPSAGGTNNNWFGEAIAVGDGVVAVGVERDDDNGSNAGTVYLFDAATGALITKLFPNDAMGGDLFGWSVAIDNGVVAVGALRDNDNGSDSGSAYLFDESTGVQIAKLLPSDGASDDEFGKSIAIDNGVVAVGAWNDRDNGSFSGSAYLFDAATGVQTAKLLPNDGEGGDEFGVSIAIANGVVAVGAHRKDNDDFKDGSKAGAAYLFRASTGVQIAKLLPSDGLEDGFFGGSIAMADGVVVVGSIGDGNNGNESGAAYLFNTSTGFQTAKLLPSDGAQFDGFGFSVAISNSVVAVGSRSADSNGPNSGSAYLFDASTGDQVTKLLPSDGAANDRFGWSIGIANGVVAVGAMWDDGATNTSGSAYVFTAPEANCPADLTGDGILDFFDVSDFLTAFGENDPIADFTGDGLFDFFDVSDFLTAFAQGCP